MADCGGVPGRSRGRWTDDHLAYDQGSMGPMNGAIGPRGNVYSRRNSRAWAACQRARSGPVCGSCPASPVHCSTAQASVLARVWSSLAVTLPAPRRPRWLGSWRAPRQWVAQWHGPLRFAEEHLAGQGREAAGKRCRGIISTMTTIDSALERFPSAIVVPDLSRIGRYETAR